MVQHIRHNEPMSESSDRPAHGRDLTLAGVLIVLAGASGVCSFLVGWARISYPTAEPSVAVDAVGHARLGLYLGLFMILAGLVVLTIGSSEVKGAWASTGIACGLAVGAFAIVDLVSERNRAIGEVIDRAVRNGVGSAGQIRGQLEHLIVFTFRPGIYLALASAALAIAAAVLMFVHRRAADRAGDNVGPVELHDD
jgi:hypothetical protein